MKNFDEYIQRTVRMFTHPVWFVIRDEARKCPCVDHDSKQAKDDCQICFGTGNKVSLARVKASNQNASVSYRGTGMAYGEKDIVNVYYTENPTDIKPGDIVYDHKDLDIVTDVYYERSDSSDIVYWRIETVPLKNNPNIIRQNLKKVLREAGYDE